MLSVLYVGVHHQQHRSVYVAETRQADIDWNEMEYNSTLIYSVIESRHIELRRRYENKDLTPFTARESLIDYIHNIYYDRVVVANISTTFDRGYFVYHDVLRGRNIYVSCKEVGLSFCFHEAKEISSLFHLINKSSNHQHYQDMTHTTKQWWIDNMQYVALQILDTEGNVVLFCNKGRTRSPMYLVAYLIIMYSMTVSHAMSVVGKLLEEQRGLTIDRHDSLVPVVDHIFEGTDVLG